MEYFLKQFDKSLLKFSATTDTSEPEIQMLWIDEENRSLLPLDLTLTPEGLSRSQEPRLCSQSAGKMRLEFKPATVYYQHL